MIYTVMYLNKHNGMWERAGYKETLKGARKLAKVFNDPRLTDQAPVIWMGQPGGMRVEG